MIEAVAQIRDQFGSVEAGSAGLVGNDRFGALSGDRRLSDAGGQQMLVADSRVSSKAWFPPADPDSFRGVSLKPDGSRLLQSFRALIDGGKPESHFDLIERRNAKTGKYEVIMVSRDPAGRKFPVLLVEGNRSAPARMQEFGQGQPLAGKMSKVLAALNAPDNRLPAGSGGPKGGNPWDLVVGGALSVIDLGAALPQALEGLGRVTLVLPRTLWTLVEAGESIVTGQPIAREGASNWINMERREQFMRTSTVGEGAQSLKDGTARLLGADPNSIAYGIGNFIGPMLFVRKAPGAKLVVRKAPGAKLAQVKVINGNIATAPLGQVVDAVKRMSPEFIARMKTHPDTAGTFQALQNRLANAGGAPGAAQQLQRLTGSVPASPGAVVPRSTGSLPPASRPVVNIPNRPATPPSPGSITAQGSQPVAKWNFTPKGSAVKLQIQQLANGQFQAIYQGKPYTLQARSKAQAEAEINAKVTPSSTPASRPAPTPAPQASPVTEVTRWTYTAPKAAESVELVLASNNRFYMVHRNKTTPLQATTKAGAEQEINRMVVKSKEVWDYTPKGFDAKVTIFRRPDGGLSAQYGKQVIDLNTNKLDAARKKLDGMVPKAPAPAPRPAQAQAPTQVWGYTPKGAAEQQTIFRRPDGGLSARITTGEILDLKTRDLKVAQKKLDAMVEKAPAPALTPTAKPTPADIAQTQSPVTRYADKTGTWDGGNSISPNPPDDPPTTFQLSTPTTQIEPQMLLAEVSSANVPRVEQPGANGGPIKVPTGKFDLTNPANTSQEGRSIDGTGPQPTSGFNPMLTVGSPQPTIGPTNFDSMGQQRSLTIASFDNLTPSAQDQFVALLQAGNPLAYGKKSAEAIKGALADASQVGVATLAQPAELAPGTSLKAFVVAPAGTVLKAGTTLPGEAAIAADATLSKATILPAGTLLPNGLTLPVGTVAGAATMTEKMAAFGDDSLLDNVLYLGQVIGNPALPGGGGQAFAALVNQAMESGKVVVAVTQDPNNFFNPSTGKAGAYGKTPLPTFGATWVHKDGSGVNQADRSFFNFNTTDPNSNQMSNIGGRSIFAGEQQLTPDAVKEAREALGLDTIKGGRRIMFGWVPPGKEVPKFVWEDDSARALGGTNGQPVGTTWNFWLPVNPGPLDPSKLPLPTQLSPPSAPPGNLLTSPQVTKPFSPGVGMTPSGLGTPNLSSAPQRPIVPQNPIAQDTITNIQASVGEPAIFPVTVDNPGSINLLTGADRKLVQQLFDGYKDVAVKGTVGSLNNRVVSGVSTAFMDNVGSPFANTPIGGAIVQYGQTGAGKVGQLMDHLGTTPVGKGLSFFYGQTIGNPGFQEGLAKFSEAAGGTAKTAANATLGLLATGAATGTLQVTTFRGTDANLSPVQKEILRRTGLPENAEISAAYAPIPGSDAVNGRAILWKATLPSMLLPPGLPGQPGTAQTTAGLTATGRVLVAPSAAAAGPTVVGGTMLGTPNMSINYTHGLSGGSVGLNPFLARIGQSMSVGANGAVKFSNPADVGAALSVAPYRYSQLLTVNLGPGQVRLARLVDPIFLTADASTGGIVIKPDTRVTSFMAPQFATNGAFDPNAADVQTARKALEQILNGGVSTPPNPLPPGAKP